MSRAVPMCYNSIRDKMVEVRQEYCRAHHLTGNYRTASNTWIQVSTDRNASPWRRLHWRHDDRKWRHNDVRGPLAGLPERSHHTLWCTCTAVSESPGPRYLILDDTSPLINNVYIQSQTTLKIPCKQAVICRNGANTGPILAHYGMFSRYRMWRVLTTKLVMPPDSWLKRCLNDTTQHAYCVTLTRQSRTKWE